MRDAVGFDAARGDSVNVVNSSFLGAPPVEEGELESIPIWEKGWFQTLAKVLAGLIVLLIIVFSVLKPLTRGLLNAAKAPVLRQGALAAAVAAGGAPAGPAGAGEAPGLAVRTAGRAARGLVAQDPKRGAQVVKQWCPPMNEPHGGRTGVERAAILLLTLGESEAAEILKHMGAKDVQRLGRTMAELQQRLARTKCAAVLGEFTAAVEDPDFAGRGLGRLHPQACWSTRSARRKAASLMERISLGGQRKGLDALKWMDARAVADLVRNEHPQIIAIVLSYLDTDQVGRGARRACRRTCVPISSRAWPRSMACSPRRWPNSTT